MINRWVIEVIGAPGTVYANETYQLQVDFPEHYPMESPQVSFNPLAMIFLRFTVALLLLFREIVSNNTFKTYNNKNNTPISVI